MAEAESQVLAEITPDPDVKLRTVLDRAASKIEGQFPDEPLVEAAIRRTIGKAYHSLGEYKLATPHLERSLQLRQQHLGMDHPNAVNTELDILRIRTELGDYQSTASRLAELVAHCERVFGSDAEATLQAMHDQSFNQGMFGHFAEAEILARAKNPGDTPFLCFAT